MLGKYYAVVLYPEAVKDAVAVLGSSIKDRDTPRPYVECKAIDPNGPYFRMTSVWPLKDGTTLDVEVQISHAYIRGVVELSDRNPLGFT